MSRLFDRLKSGRSKRVSDTSASSDPRQMPRTERVAGYGQDIANPQPQPVHPDGYSGSPSARGFDPRIPPTGQTSGYPTPQSPHVAPPAVPPSTAASELAGPERSAPAAAAPASRRKKARTPDLRAPARRKHNKRTRGNAPIVEANSVTGKSLTVVISIMCFLASLTAGAVYLINQSASAWTQNIASEVTVQIAPAERESAVDMDKRITQIAFFLAKQRGITDVRPMSRSESARLLEPWLGSSTAVSELPIPRLIAIELDRRAPPDFARLKSTLERTYAGAKLDDHRHWQRQIKTVTGSLALGGLIILLLVAVATTGIIVSATQSAMASNREIVEVLHFVGATDRFIAREFEKHFLTLGVKAGLVGALIAMAVFALIPYVLNMLGGGTVTMSELRRLVGTGALDMPGYFLLGIVVVIIAALCMITSRYGVFSILNGRD